MRNRLALAGQDPDGIGGGVVPLTPLDAPPKPGLAFARAQALKERLEGQAQHRRN